MLKLDEQSTPAGRIIGRFGIKTLAFWTGRHRSRISAWKWPPERGGTGGAIPRNVRQAIIDGARREGLGDLTYADFEPQGGEVYLLQAAA